MLAGGKWLRLAMTLGVLGSLFSWTGCGDSGNQGGAGGSSKSTTTTQGGGSDKKDDKQDKEKGSADTTKKAGGAVKRFAFITNGDDPFWDALNSGLQVGKEKYNLEADGYDVQRYVNDSTALGQVNLMRQFANDPEIAGVAISVIEANNAATVEEMKKLQAKGVKVITVDSDVERKQFRDARTYYIGTENYTGGKALGTAAKAILNAKGQKKGAYAQFAGYTNVDNARMRMDGVKDALGDAYEDRDRMADNMNLSAARDNVRTALTNHSDLNLLVGIWAYNAPAIAEVVAERGVREKMTVVTFDAQELAITKMVDGQIDAMVVQDPFDMGVQTVRLLKAMCEDNKEEIAKMFPKIEQPEGDIFTTGLRVVVPNADSPVKPDMFDPKVVEFMTLPDFQAWLKKYGLRSS